MLLPRRLRKVRLNLILTPGAIIMTTITARVTSADTITAKAMSAVITTAMKAAAVITVSRSKAGAAE